MGVPNAGAATVEVEEDAPKSPVPANAVAGAVVLADVPNNAGVGARDDDANPAPPPNPDVVVAVIAELPPNGSDGGCKDEEARNG